MLKNFTVHQCQLGASVHGTIKTICKWASLGEWFSKQQHQNGMWIVPENMALILANCNCGSFTSFSNSYAHLTWIEHIKNIMKPFRVVTTNQAVSKQTMTEFFETSEGKKKKTYTKHLLNMKHSIL